jgi:hypothetical protein
LSTDEDTSTKLVDLFPRAVHIARGSFEQSSVNEESWEFLREGLATAIVAAKPRERFEQLAPGISKIKSQDIRSFNWWPLSTSASVRTYNCFQSYATERRVEDWSALSEQSVVSFIKFKNVGRKTAIEFVGALLQLSLEFQRSPFAFSADVPGPIEVERELDLEAQAVRSRLSRTIDDTIQWIQVVSPLPTIADLLNRVAAGNYADDLRHGVDELLNTPLATLMPVPSVESAFDKLLQGLDERSIFILRARHRIGVAKRPTLQEVADLHGITRERIRQIESKALKRISDALNAPNGRICKWLGAEVRARLGEAIPIEAARAHSLVRQLEACQYPEIGLKLLMSECCGYSEVDGWAVRRLSDLRKSVNESLDKHGVLTLDLEEVSERLGIQHGFLAKFLGEICKLKQVSGKWVAPCSGLGDWAVVALIIAGKPMTPEEIIEAIPVERSTGSLINALSESSLTIRTDRREYGLVQWGLEEYSGVAQEIEERIERAGGVADVESVINELTDQFSVTASTVRAYIYSPRFIVEDSRVRLRHAEEAITVSAKPSQSRGYFLVGERMAFLLTVDADLLRGSGRNINACAIAGAQLVYGEAREFDADGVTISVSWSRNSNQPSLGSIRDSLIAIGSKPGDRVRVELFRNSERARISKVDESLVASGNPIDAIGQLTGIFADNNDGLRRELSMALECAPTEIKSRLRAPPTHSRWVIPTEKP